MNLILVLIVVLLVALCVWLAVALRRRSQVVAWERRENEALRTQLSGVEAEALRLHTVRRDFVANISHELRTPLASIKLLVETLEDGALHDETVAAPFLHKIGQETDHLIEMAQELLDLARLEGAPAIQPRALDPATVVTQAVERMRELARNKDVSLSVDLPPDLPRVLGDDGQIGRVFVNLLSNAVAFTPAGGVVTIGARVDGDGLDGGRVDGGRVDGGRVDGGRVAGGRVAFGVSDTGPGIPPGEEARIFERFYKADAARQRGGVGLGLSIARHIVEAHGGKMWAHNRPQGGACVTFTLPVATPALVHAAS